MLRKFIFTAFAFFLGSLAGPNAYAYQFTPTDIEWHSWPGYCKAKYVWTNVGKRSKFANMATDDDQQQLVIWERAGIRGLHHYCTGSIWLSRATRANNDSDRASMLRNALSETAFAYERSNAQSLQFTNIATQFATIEYEQGNFDEALHILGEAIAANPRNGLLYSATAIVQRRLGRLDDAKVTLIQGHKLLDGQSAEINYNLGLVSLELGEVDDAVKYAQLAYDLGYPLPGLRVKLEQLGRM